MGAKCKLYCTMGGLNLKKGGASKITMSDVPSLDKNLHDVIEAGVHLTARGPSKEMLKQIGVTPETLEEGVEFEDVIGFLNAALPASKKGGMFLFI